MLQEQWNPISLTESRNFAKVLREIVEEYPTANSKSPQMKLILKAIYDKAKVTIEADLFVPLYSKEYIFLQLLTQKKNFKFFIIEIIFCKIQKFF